MAAKLKSMGRKLWLTLGSIKTGVTLLILVAIVAGAGTLILQRPTTDPQELQRAYSPVVLRILDATGLTNVFEAWWFMVLLTLVSISIVVASIERFPDKWRYFARPYKSPDPIFRKALPTQTQIPIPDEETGLVTAERALHEMGFKPERVAGAERISLFAERNRFSEMAVFIIHASLLLIFLGWMVDGAFGWRGFIALGRGEQLSQVELRNGSKKQLPFALRCDGAGQENYPDGTPKRWWSKLAILEDGRETLKKEIAVNDPLVYRGLRFYQASYGMTGKMDKLLLTATPANGNGPAQEIGVGLNETVQLDADTSVRLVRFIPDFVVRDGQVYTRSEQPENPAVEMIVESKKPPKTAEVWLPAVPGIAHNEDSPYKFQARDLQMAYFTGLQVSSEPGQWAVWGGCLLLAVGLGTAFYLVHIRLWVVPVRDARGHIMLWVGGAANKNRDVFREKFVALTGVIEKELSKTQTQARPERQAASFVSK